MEHVLYRKYRPRTFKDAIGQEHVTTTLQHAIKSGRISHAYLFTGPRGVGKTSIARILAFEANKLPYKDDAVHLDIIEIDAASNRRIDEIRDLRDKVRIAPAAAKYKVYIIDEVHMLTREAFNALLKTLEEPPAHVIFILATTEAHKLPDTIISRTQRFEFKPVPSAKVAKHLESIAKKESIDITPGALILLADFGEGSFRDSISYLDQLSSIGKSITEDEVRQLLGMPSTQEASAIVEAVQMGDMQSLVIALQSIRDKGTGAAELASAISKDLRSLLIDGQAGPNESQLIKELINVAASPEPYDFLEITLMEAVIRKGGNHQPARQNSEAIPAKGTKISSGDKKTVEPTENPPKPQTTVKNHREFNMSVWAQVVEQSRSRAASLYTALRLAEPAREGEVLILRFRFPLHKKKAETAKSRALISELIEEASGINLNVVCEVDKSIKQPPAASPITAQPESPVNSITNIFGSAEMLEV